LLIVELEDIKQLIVKYNNGTASEAEKAQVIAWYESIEGDQPVFAEGEFDAITQEVHQSLIQYRLANHQFVQQSKLWPRIIGVAAAAAALVFGIWFYNHGLSSSRNASGNDLAYQNDIAPGKNTATLTLPHGKTIKLSDAKTGVVVGTELKYNDGTAVERGDPGLPQNDVMLSAATPRGGTYQFTLPDGTHVWLNAASKISFPSQFSGATRKILLSGEAYFEVTKNKTKPFIVQSKGQRVEVLGTHFNINAYPDESNIRTTLLEGSVRIEGKLILKPGEQSNISSDRIVSVKQIDPNTAIDWKNGDFVFQNDDFKTIMRKVSRWYDVEIIYDKTAPAELPLGGLVSRSKNISSILKIMEATGDVHFKVEGRRITVTK
jgi:transmembrane sensor